MKSAITKAMFMTNRRYMKQHQRDMVKRHIEIYGVNKTDPELAVLLNTTKDTVGQVRREMGLKSYLDARRDGLVHDPEFLTAPAHILAERHGYSVSGVNELRDNKRPRLYANSVSAWINPLLREWARGHVEMMSD